MERYGRQEKLIGRAAQEKLKKSTAAIIGLGAIGTVSAQILARAGVNLILADRDIVQGQDLQRQLFDEADIDKPKAQAAMDRLKKANSQIHIQAMDIDINGRTISKLGRPDILLDCTDNIETRLLINDYCLKNKIRWVHAAAIQHKAQMAVFSKPCYRCIFERRTPEGTCETLGVLAVATMQAAAMQSAEAIMMLAGGRPRPMLIVADTISHQTSSFKISGNCRSCQGKYDYLTRESKPIQFCGGIYQFSMKIDIEKLRKQIPAKDYGSCLSFQGMTIFKDRALVKAQSEAAAKARLARYIQ